MDQFSQEQIAALDAKLDPRFVSNRKGGNNAVLKYIEGHDAIDQANRIFGYGNWAYRPLSCEQVVLLDPLSGEAVGIEYKAMVELIVRGAVAPIVDVGSQPVAVWNVEDHIMTRRTSNATYNKKPIDESPFTWQEKKLARAIIVESHEQAKKGAVTDAMKRALRAYGEQFGNGLYGDGRIDMFNDEAHSPANTSTKSKSEINKQPVTQKTTVQPISQTPIVTSPSKPQTSEAPQKQVAMTKSQATTPTVALEAIPTVSQLRKEVADLKPKNAKGEILNWDAFLAYVYRKEIEAKETTLEALVKVGDELGPEQCKRIAGYITATKFARANQQKPA